MLLQIDPTAVKPGAATTSEGVLANFFNSLLSKKTGGVAGGQPGSLPGPATPPGAKMGGASSDDCEYSNVLFFLSNSLTN